MCENYCRIKLLENIHQINIFQKVKQQRLKNSKQQFDEDQQNNNNIFQQIPLPTIKPKYQEQNDKNNQIANIKPFKKKINYEKLKQYKIEENRNKRSISVERQHQINYLNNYNEQNIDHFDKVKKTIVIFSERQNPLKNDYIYRFCKRNSFSSQSRRSSFQNNMF